MSEPQEKILAFDNQFFEFGTQTVEGVECVSTPFPVIYPVENFLMLKLSAMQLRELFSVIQIGAEWAYPDKSHQILFNFMKALVCPPLMLDQECFEYPTFASFIQYNPINPFIEPDTIPDGYLIPPFHVQEVAEDDLLPNDIIVPFGAFELLAGWLDLMDGIVPQIAITVNGAGFVYVKLITMPFGGLAVVSLDNPPNIADIIIGIILGSDNIVDLNLDEVSVPPETAREIIFPVEITSAGLHTVYVDFIPIMDDSLVPLRFGGGFRGVQLCNFIEEIVDMSVQDIRINGCEIEYFKNGEWVGLVSGSLDACYATNSEVAALGDYVGEQVVRIDEHDVLLAGLDDSFNALAELLLEYVDIVDMHETRLDTIDVELADHEARIVALELIESFNWDWEQEFDFTNGEHGWAIAAGPTARGSYVASEGYLSEADAVSQAVDIFNSDEPYQNQIFWISMETSAVGTVPSGMNVKWKYGENPSFELAKIAGYDTVSVEQTGYFRNLNEDSISMGGVRALSNSAAAQFYIRKLTFFGMGVNPFA